MRIRISKNTLAVGLLVAAVASAATGGTGEVANVADANVPVPGGGATLNCSQLEALWQQAGGSAGTAFLAAEVARAESGGNPGSTDDDGNGTVDRGLWQINSIWGSGSTYDELANAKAAVSISQDGTNWNPWVTFDRGMENGQC